MWYNVPRYVEKPVWKEIRPTRNLKVVLSLFVPTIAVQIYTVLDKTMIGLIAQSSFENGYYEQAIRISKSLLVMVTSFGAVMIPRIGYHYGKGESEQVKSYIYRDYRFVWFLGIPLCLGLVGVAPNFVPWFFGSGYEKVVPLLKILSFLILAIGVNNATSLQYLIPTKRQNIVTMTVMIGAGVNFALNLILIYFFQSVGAAVSSVAAETTIALVQLWIVRKELSPKEIFLSGGHYLFAGGIMLIVLKAISNSLTPSILHTSIMVICGAVTYGGVLIALRDEAIKENMRSIIGKFIKRK